MTNKKIQEGLGELADMAERDHEVQMARADLYKIAKYAIKLHDMLKGVSEAEGIEGWQQSKITKAADYISSVYHALDYDMQFGEGEVTEASKPDYIDIDGDGNKKEPMKKAAKDAKKKKKTDESAVAAYKEKLKTQLAEKAKSKAQQKLMGMAYAYKTGNFDGTPSAEVKNLAKSMSKKDLEDFASTKHKGKPEHVKKK